MNNMEELRNIINIMALIGIPSLFGCVMWFGKQVIQFGKRMDILMNAVQKQMRRDLMEDYHRYMDAGYISDDDLEEWTEGYKAYHELGKNGVMDKKWADLIELNSHPKRS